MAVEIIGDDSDCDLKIDESFDQNDIETPAFFPPHTSTRTNDCVSPNDIPTRSPSPVPEKEEYTSKSSHNSFKNEMSNKSSTSSNIISSISQQKIDTLSSIKTALSDDTKIIRNQKDKIFSSDNSNLTIGAKDCNIVTCGIDGRNSNSSMEMGPTTRKRKHCLEIENKSDASQNKHNKTDISSSDVSEKNSDSTHSLNVKFHYKFNSSIFISTEINGREMHGILMPGGVTDISLSGDKNEKGIENFDPAISNSHTFGDKIIKKEVGLDDKHNQSSNDQMPSTSKDSLNPCSNILINTSGNDTIVKCPLNNCGYQFINLIDACEHLKKFHMDKELQPGQSSRLNVEPVQHTTIGTMTDMLISKNLSPNNNDVLHKPKAEKVSPVIHPQQSAIKVTNKIENPKVEGAPPFIQGNIIDPKVIMAASVTPFNFQPPGMQPLVKNNLGQSTNSSTASTPIKQQESGAKHKIHELKPNPSNNSTISPSTAKSSRANSTTSNGLNNYQIDPLRPSSVSTSLNNQTGMTMGLNPFGFPPGANPFAGMGPQMGLPNQNGASNQMMNMFNPMVMQAAAAAQMRNQMFMMPNMGMQGGQMPEQIALQMAMLGQMQQK
uniref:C2H2-type domain-containing protein n=1 Tax=Strongyloides papillosus TaxID=174720 RepID=A0A0N5BA58_STREA